MATQYTRQQLRDLKVKTNEEVERKLVNYTADAIKEDIYRAAELGKDETHSFVNSKYASRVVALVKETYPDIKYTQNEDVIRAITRFIFDWSD